MIGSWERPQCSSPRRRHPMCSNKVFQNMLELVVAHRLPDASYCHTQMSTAAVRA